jgi:peptide/nickel transport system permease protein
MNWTDWLSNVLVLSALALVGGLVVAAARGDRWRRAWLRLRKDRLGIIAGLIIVLYLFIGALEMLVVPVSSGGKESLLGLLTSNVAVESTYSAPLATTTLSTKDPRPLRGRHLLGTDALGKDVLVQTLRACRTALVIGGLTSLIYLPVGTLLGIYAGYYRRWVDDVIQYVYTVLYSIPDILLLIAILMVLGTREITLFGVVVAGAGKSLGKMAFALSITAWIGLCRLVRGETLRQAQRPYVDAARAVGQSNWKIITQHLIPNVMHLVVINLVLGFSSLVLAEAMLSYLGVGSPIGTASWGNMIDGARGELSREPVVWWTLTAATTALFGLVLSLNLFGDSLRRAFDPRQG